jgi:hypothetical protein
MSQCTPSTTIKGRRKEGRERKKMDKIETSKKKKVAVCWWLTPIILATQEAEIRISI